MGGSVAMTRTVILKGRLVDPNTVELAEPAAAQVGSEVEVVTHVPAEGGKNLSEVIASLPPGTRSKEEIDRRIREDRDAW
jgi:hypothetical protein